MTCPQLQAVHFLPEVVRDVPRDLADALRVQCLAVFGSTQFLLVLFARDRAKARASIVVVHLGLERLLVADGVGDDLCVQFVPEHTAVVSAPSAFRGKIGCR